jgi:hypothetical protein
MPYEPVLDKAERHVREGEQRVRRQLQLIARLELAGHHEVARRGRELLAAFADTLDAAKAHLAQERCNASG